MKAHLLTSSKTIIASALSLLLTNIYAGTPLSGSYSINSQVPTGGTNFISFTDFATAINSNGVSASVNVTVTPGTGPYHEQVVINPITGGGPNSQVTLDGSGELLTAVTSSAQRHVFRLAGVSYFNLSNLHVAWDTASTGGFYGIHLLDSARHVVIANCNINLSGTTSTLYGAIVASGSETSILDPGNFHDVLIGNNTTRGGGYGVSVYGEGNNLSTNIVIGNNMIYDFHSNGIYLRETDGTVVTSNTFDKQDAAISSANAIQVAQAANINAQIHNNTISVSQTNNGSMTIRGIYLFDGTGHKVFNNVINNIQLISGNFTAIEVRTGATAPEISFNTIALDHISVTSGDLTGIAEELSNTNSVLRNNLISISQSTTGSKTGLLLGAISTVTSALNSNYNDIYVPGGNFAVKGSLTPTFYSTRAVWNGASGQDANSKELNPQFFSPTLSKPFNSALDNSGITLLSVPIDITGALRGNPPDIGAYEFGTVGMNKNQSAETITAYPVPANNAVNFSNKGFYLAEIFNASGALVKSIVINANAIVQLDISDLDNGFYIVNLIGTEKNYHTSFVKK